MNKNYIFPYLVGALFSASSAYASSSPFNNLTDQIIVKFGDKTIDGQTKAKGLKERINKELTFIRQTDSGEYIFKLPTKESLAQVYGYARAVMAVDGVYSAEPDAILFPIGTLTAPPNEGQFIYTPSDGYQIQWHYHDSTSEPFGMNAPGAWNILDSTDSPVTVAVIDTGITDHPDLNDNMVSGTDMISNAFIANDNEGSIASDRDTNPADPGDWLAIGECGTDQFSGNPIPAVASDSSWHGTHVAGTIAAITNNGVGVAGIGYNLLRVMPIRALGKCGGYTSDIADGITWAALQGAKVVNMSIGGPGSCESYLQSKINSAVQDYNVTIVVSAGNSSADASNFSPASCNNVITVAASNRLGKKASYSNIGSVVDLAAPGGDSSGGILSTLNSGKTGPADPSYAFSGGTSMATPHVSAVAGLMYVQDSNITPATVRSNLVSTTRAFSGSCNDCGSGVLDAGNALSINSTSTPVVTIPAAPEWFPVVGNNDGTVSFSWTDNSMNEDGFTIKVSTKNKRRWTGYSSLTVAEANTSFLNYPIAPGTYNFSIESFNSAGNSQPDFYTTEVVVTDSSSTGGESTGGGGSGKGGKGGRK